MTRNVSTCLLAFILMAIALRGNADFVGSTIVYERDRLNLRQCRDEIGRELRKVKSIADRITIIDPAARVTGTETTPGIRGAYAVEVSLNGCNHTLSCEWSNYPCRNVASGKSHLSPCDDNNISLWIVADGNCAKASPFRK
jgi:hypothetical protein